MMLKFMYTGTVVLATDRVRGEDEALAGELSGRMALRHPVERLGGLRPLLLVEVGPGDPVEPVPFRDNLFA